MNNKDEIILSNEDFEEFYESFGSNHFQLQSKILGDLGTNQLNIYFKSIGFATTVIGAIGLIAGFGFTALGHVEHMFLFISGEGLLFAGLFYGLWWVQQKYQSEFNGIETELKKHLVFYKKRNDKFLIVFNDWIKTKMISRKGFADLNETDNKYIELFEDDKDRKAPLIYSQTVYVLMILGTIGLLSSFIHF